MAIRIANNLDLWAADAPGNDFRSACLQCVNLSWQIIHHKLGGPKNKIVRPRVAGQVPATGRSDVFQEFNTRSPFRPQRGNTEISAKNLIEVLLFHPVITCGADDLESDLA